MMISSPTSFTRPESMRAGGAPPAFLRRGRAAAAFLGALTAALGAALVLPPTALAATGPKDELLQANAKLKKHFASKSPSWSPEADARNAKIKEIVGGFLDFEELAQRALIRHWDKLSPAKRAEFVRTLRELVERNYVKQLYGQPHYRLKLEEEEIEGDQAVVRGTLLAKSRGKKVTMALEYKLLRKANRWVVYDVVTDDLSLLENYRADFNKVIAKESFDALLAKMKKKLAEKDG